MDPYEFFYRRQKQMHPAVAFFKLVLVFLGALAVAAVISILAGLAMLAFSV